MKSAFMLSEIILPGLRYAERILPGQTFGGQKACVMILSIFGQESGLKYRLQQGGPAKSWGQFERGGGVNGVFNSPITRFGLASICESLEIPFDRETIYNAMAWNDHLAVFMARALLLTDAAPLPGITDVEGSWNYYQRNWRPGKPDKSRWVPNHSTAVDAVLVSKEVV